MPGVETAVGVTVDALADRFTLGVLLGFLAGATVPTYYAQERMRGFGRAVVSRLPYRPPPGQSEEEALREAQAAADGPEADDAATGAENDADAESGNTDD
jgi:hypothetical protein